MTPSSGAGRSRALIGASVGVLLICGALWAMPGVAGGAEPRVAIGVATALPGQVVRLGGPGVVRQGAAVTIGGRRARVVGRRRGRLLVLVPRLPARTHRVLVRSGGRRSAGRLRIRRGLPGRVQPVLESRRASVASIGPAGGVVRARAADGTAFELSVPAGALERVTAIRMTPVTRLNGEPFAGTPTSVQFGPDGLRLVKPATLRVTFRRAPGRPLVGLSYRGSGSGFALRRATRKGRVVTTTVEHFSGGGTLPATLANFLVVLSDLAAKPQLTVEDAEDFFDTKPAADAVLGRGWCLADPTCSHVRERALDVFDRDVERTCGGSPASTIPPLAEAVRRLLAIEETEQAEGVRPSGGDCRRRIVAHMLSLVDGPARDDPLGVSGACAGALGDADGDGQTRGVECAIAVGAIAAEQGFADLQAKAREAAVAGLRNVIADNAPKCDAPGTFADGLRLLRQGAANAAPYALLTAEFNAALEECVRITVTPSAVSVEVGKTADFTAKGKDPSDSSFTWATSRSDAKIDAAGHLTVPDKPGTVTVIASSAAHPDREGRALVTITCPAGQVDDGGTCKTVTVTISPTTVALARGASQRFTATVLGTSDTRVTWSQSGPGSITQATGSDAGGLYTAGQTDGSFTVTVSSLQFPTVSATAQVTVGSGTVTVTLRKGNLASTSSARVDRNAPGEASSEVTSINPPSPSVWGGTLLGVKQGSFASTAEAQLPPVAPTVTASASADVSATSSVTVDAQDQLHAGLTAGTTQDVAADQDTTSEGYVQGALGDTTNLASDNVSFTVTGGAVRIACGASFATLPASDPTGRRSWADQTSVRLTNKDGGGDVFYLSPAGAAIGNATLPPGRYALDMHAGTRVFANNGWLFPSSATLDPQQVHFTDTLAVGCDTTPVADDQFHLRAG